MYLCGAENQRGSAWLLYVYTACSWRGLSPLLSAGGSLEFKRFKAISQEGGASDCRPSNTDRPTTPSLSPADAHPFPPLLSSRFDCDLLRTFKRAMPPCPKKTVPFGAKNFRQRERWCGRPARLLAIRFVVTCVAGIASFVVCDNNFYDAHWLSGDRWRYCGPRRGETPPRRARIREGLS